MTKNELTYEGALDATARKQINDNFFDVSYSTTQFDAVTGTTGATLTNVVGLVTGTLQPGRYTFEVNLATVATTNCGLKVGFKQSVASMFSSIEYNASYWTAAAVATARGTTVTDQTSMIASTTAIIRAQITGIVVVGAAGTIQLQAAQNAAHADTTSVFVNSWMRFQKI